MDCLNRAEGLPQAVLFDWDNTLVDNWGCIQASLNVALVTFGQEPWTLEETLARLKLSPRDALPRIFGDDWEPARDIFYAEFERRHLDYLKPLSGAEDLLSCMREASIYLGVVSNKTGRFLRKEAEYLKWDRFFGRIVGSADAVADKPDPAPVALALEPSGLRSGADVWFVGDTDVDMDCARNAGCIPILIDAGVMSAEERERARPALCLSSCDELAALVRGRMHPISAKD